MVLPRTCAARRLRQNINNAEKLVTRLSTFLRKWNFEVLRNVTFPVPGFSHLILTAMGISWGKR
jgi:hypothetical protein